MRCTELIKSSCVLVPNYSLSLFYTCYSLVSPHGKGLKSTEFIKEWVQQEILIKVIYVELP